MNRSVSAFRKVEYPERNVLINGAFDFWQRGGPFTGTNIYTADRWKNVYSHTATHSISNASADVPSELADQVYSSLKYTVTSGSATGAAEFSLMGYPIEGYHFTALMGKYVTISFYAKTNLPGTYTCLLKSGVGNYRYTFEFEISQADTWERIEKTVYIINSAPSNTFGRAENLGCCLYINLGVGSNYHTTPDTWVDGSFFGTSGANDLMATTNNYFSFTGVMLTEGDKTYPFQRKNLSTGQEFIDCCRYYVKQLTGGNNVSVGWRLSPNQLRYVYKNYCPMRAVPSVEFHSTLDTYPNVFYGYNNATVSANSTFTYGAWATKTDQYIYWTATKTGAFSGLPAGIAYYSVYSGGQGAYIAFNAEF